MTALSNYIDNLLIDGLLRGGALGAGGAVNSVAVVKGVWTATTAYVAGDVVTPHALMTGAGGKFLRCTTGGTSGSTNTLAVPAVGSTLTDGSVTWTAVSGMPSLLTVYAALLLVSGERANSQAYVTGATPASFITLTANDGKRHMYRCTTSGTTAAAQSTLYPGVPGEVIADGTASFTEQSDALDANSLTALEPSGGSYARVAITCSLANFAGTQAAASTTASTGTGGTTSNNGAITFPAPTGNWGVAGAVVLMDQLTSGNLVIAGVLATPKTINNGDAAPSFSAAALTFQIDN